MGRYVARRLLETIPLMIIISIVVFMFIHLIPGDPAKTLAGVEAPLEEVEAIREELGLNDPLIIQYFNWVKDALRGDLGRSFKSDLPVTELIWSRFQFTIQLVFAGLVWAPFVGIFIGVMCAIKRGTWIDLGGML
ncbi:MAG: ABC transporter permease, partial [Lachnospiraceae bacterium]|nr:ABC transporter permease [Lachnospiraceae bacterium]